ncbi:MAG: NAD-dependent epimerase/dehydratase family protein [Bacteroidetes bacterium]|nr:NAD-dependent epimerase/dehydratase family protein [Bacteroidota bacterium]
MKTLVTGTTGFLGATLTRRLVQEGVSVRGLRRASSTLDLLGDAARHVDWTETDILDVDGLELAFQGVSRVFHCAAFMGFEGKRSKSKLYSVNVQGTANVVNAALSVGVDRLVHTSSIAALGRSENDSGCLDETTEWRPSPMNTGYAESKHLAELEIQRGIAEGLDAVIVNPSLVMGVGRTGENTMLIIETIRKGRLPFVPGGGTNVVDVLDVVDGLLRAMERGETGRRYILAGQNMMWKEFAIAVAVALGVSPPRRTISRRSMSVIATISECVGWITRTSPLITRETTRLSSIISCYDNTRAIQELGCTFRSFDKTMKRIAASM